jgi:hypothetical protein
MHSLEEMTAWTPDVILAEIVLATPAGWTFQHIYLEGWWQGRVLDAEGTTLWEDTHADQKILFFNAYGWLTLRGQKPQHPIWKLRTSEIDPNRHAQHAPSAKDAAGPEDLDPAEVRAVYSNRRERE